MMFAKPAPASRGVWRSEFVRRPPKAVTINEECLISEPLCWMWPLKCAECRRKQGVSGCTVGLIRKAHRGWQRIVIKFNEKRRLRQGVGELWAILSGRFRAQRQCLAEAWPSLEAKAAYAGRCRALKKHVRYVSLDEWFSNVFWGVGAVTASMCLDVSVSFFEDHCTTTACSYA